MINKLQCGLNHYVSLDSLLSSNYLLALFFAIESTKIHFGVSQQTLFNWTFKTFLRSKTILMSNKQRKSCPNMGFSSKKIFTKRTNFKQWGFLSDFYAISYLHWNWILNYYLMGSFVLSLGPFLSTERTAILQNFNFLFCTINLLIFPVGCFKGETVDIGEENYEWWRWAEKSRNRQVRKEV